MSYISVADVRTACGASSTLVSDTNITAIIAVVEPAMERWLNTKFVPTSEIDTIDGTGNEIMFTKYNPLLSVRALTTNDSTVSVSELNWYRSSGKVSLGANAEVGIFVEEALNTSISYIYGMVENTTTRTTSTAATTAGASKAIPVVAVTSFALSDWVEVYGTDGHRETAQITGISSPLLTITVDQLVLTHISGSFVIKLAIPDYIKRYMVIEASIAVAFNAIGSTYTFNSSYSLGELSVTKGGPLAHWQGLLGNLLSEREMLRSRIKPRFAMAVK